jgi:hypothetical protein
MEVLRGQARARREADHPTSEQATALIAEAEKRGLH